MKRPPRTQGPRPFHSRSAFLVTLTALMLCLSTFVTLRVSANEPGGHPREVILVVGDSISAGYGIKREEGWVHIFDQSLLQAELPYRMVNASVSGETTGGALARLPALLEEHKPAIVLIELGGNDGLRGYPVKKMRANIEAMATLSTAAGAAPAIVAMRIPPNYGPRYTRGFEAAFPVAAESTGALLIPFFLEEIALVEGMMQDDGIHPTAAAQNEMSEFIWRYLQPLFG